MSDQTRQDPVEPIKVSVADTKERKRRQRELILAALVFVLIIVLTWIELKYLAVNSYLFLGLFNLNFILLLLVLFIVGRNGVKLLLERRRKVLGSKLRTRLVLAFISLSLVPTALMFFVSVKFVQTSVDYWFKSQVEDSMEQALAVGQEFYESAQERLGVRGENILGQIVERRFAWGGKAMNEFLEEKRSEYALFLLGVINPDLTEQNWHVTDELARVWPDVKATINWESIKEQPRFWSSLWPGPGMDIVVGVFPVDDGKTGYLVLGEHLGQGIMYKLDQIVRGVDEYKKLKSLKYPLKIALYFILLVLTLLIILGAMWFGFRLAKELSLPIQALASGTERIAQGDLTVRLEDQSADELGLLVRSFNKMVEDLEVSRARITEANLALESQNVELDRRGRYIEAVIDTIAAGVVSLDDEGRISTVNKATSEMLALNREAMVGLKPSAVLAGDFGDLFREVAEHIASNPGAQWQRQLDITVGGQDRKFLVNVVAIDPAEGREAGLVAVFEDITELERMQRMAAWREVAKRIAHEIKNPLTPIKLSAQRLERKFSPDIEDPAFGQCTDLIVRQVEHLQQMVKEFSEFAKLPEVVLRPDNPIPLLEEVVALFEHSHGRIQWKLAFQNAVPEIKMDREALRRTLINILTNAADALEGREDGKVAVTVAHDMKRARLRIDISDNGPGLTSEERTHVFEPYFSRKKGGTGLGLAIVKSIISDHLGSVRAEPHSSGGTRMTIELPTR